MKHKTPTIKTPTIYVSARVDREMNRNLIAEIDERARHPKHEQERQVACRSRRNHPRIGASPKSEQDMNLFHRRWGFRIE